MASLRNAACRDAIYAVRLLMNIALNLKFLVV
jgi:hypothetical protein